MGEKSRKVKGKKLCVLNLEEKRGKKNRRQSFFVLI